MAQGTHTCFADTLCTGSIIGSGGLSKSNLRGCTLYALGIKNRLNLADAHRLLE